MTSPCQVPSLFLSAMLAALPAASPENALDFLGLMARTDFSANPETQSILPGIIAVLLEKKSMPIIRKLCLLMQDQFPSLAGLHTGARFFLWKNPGIPIILRQREHLSLASLTLCLQYWKLSIPESQHSSLIQYLTWLSVSQNDDRIFLAMVSLFPGHPELSRIAFFGDQGANWYGEMMFWYTSGSTAAVQHLLTQTSEAAVDLIESRWLSSLLRAKMHVYVSLILDRFPVLIDRYIDCGPTGYAGAMGREMTKAQFATFVERYGPNGSVRVVAPAPDASA